MRGVIKHYLKAEAEYFQAAERYGKKFELRLNDRDYQPGDIVVLQEMEDGRFTGRTLRLGEITYVLEGPIFGLAEGWVIFSWRAKD